MTLLANHPIYSESFRPLRTRSQSTAEAIFRIFPKPLKMAEEVGFEPTFLPTESVTGFQLIGKLTLFRSVPQAEAKRFWGL